MSQSDQGSESELGSSSHSNQSGTRDNTEADISVTSAESPAGPQGDRRQVGGILAVASLTFPSLGDAQQQQQQQQQTTNSSDPDASNMSGQQQPSATIQRVGKGMDPTAFFSSAPTAVEKDLSDPVDVVRTSRGDDQKTQTKSKSIVTAGLPDRFTQAAASVDMIEQARIAASTEGETSIENHIDRSNLEKGLAINAAKQQDLATLFARGDLGTVFNVPKLVDVTAAADSPDRWDYDDMVNIIINPHGRTLEECKQWGAQCLLHGSETTPFAASLTAQDQEWGLLKAQNSCSTGLKSEVMEKLNILERRYRTGTVFLKYMFDILYKVNDEIISALKVVLEHFKTKGPVDVKGENIRTVKLLLMAVFRLLDANGHLPVQKDCIKIVASGLSQVTANAEFKDVFTNILTNEANPFFNTTYVAGGSATTIEVLNKILTDAAEMYDAHSLASQWKASNLGVYSVSGNCHNCGKPGHVWRQCPEKVDQAVVNKNYEAAKQSNNRSTGGQQDEKNKPLSASGIRPFEQRGKWGKPPPGKTAEKIGNRVYSACGQCQAWTTGNDAHSSKTHDQWKAHGKVDLPSDHPYCTQVRQLRDGKPNGGRGRGGRGDRGGGGRGSGGGKGGDDKAAIAAAAAAITSAMSAGFEKQAKETADSDQANMMLMMSKCFGAYPKE